MECIRAEGPALQLGGPRVQKKRAGMRPGRLELLLEDFEAEVGPSFDGEREREREGERERREREVPEKRPRLERQDSHGLGALEKMAKWIKSVNVPETKVDRWPGKEQTSSWTAELVPSALGRTELKLKLPHVNSKTSALQEKYFVFEELGRGQFGVVRACASQTDGQSYACKTIVKEKLPPGEATDGVRTETSLMGLLSRHPNIVRHVEVLEDESSVHIIMERCMGGDLYNLIDKHKWLPEELASSIFRKVVSAVAFCHEHNIIHRDLKPENILLTQGEDGAVEPKVADFGLARLVGPEGEAGKWVGSVYYMAPEVVKNQPCSRASDVWSLGALLYVMLSGFLPFKGASVQDTAARIRRGDLQMSVGPWVWVSESAKDLIRKMMHADPQRRPRACDIMSHSWFLSGPSTPPSGRMAMDFPRPTPASSPVPFASKNNVMLLSLLPPQKMKSNSPKSMSGSRAVFFETLRLAATISSNVKKSSSSDSTASGSQGFSGDTLFPLGTDSLSPKSIETCSNLKALSPMGLVGLGPKSPTTPTVESSYPRSMFFRDNSQKSS